MTVADSLEASLEAAEHIGPTHRATIELARRLAAAVDAADLAQAPRLLAALKALGLTVTNIIEQEGDDRVAGSPLDQLRARRERRAHQAASVDAAAAGPDA